MRRMQIDEFFVYSDPSSRRFRRAMAASVCAHLVVFIALAFLTAFFSSPRNTETPEAIKFIFAPEEEVPIETNAGASSPKAPRDKETPRARAIPSSVDLETPNDSPELASTSDFEFSKGESLVEEQTPLTSRQAGINLVEASPAPDFLATASDLSPIRSTQAFSPDRRHSLLNREHFKKNMRFSKARLAIPNRDRKRILKKIKKMTAHFIPPTTVDSTFSIAFDNQVFNVTVKHETANDPSAFDHLVVDVSTRSNGRTLSTRMRLQRLGFSHFAQFVDYWNPRVIVHDDKFDGRFHTNTDFSISGNDGKHPRFLGKVTTSGYNVHERLHPAFLQKDSVFQAGLEIGAAPIKFPKKLYDLVENAGRDSSVFTFKEESWIKFQRDGGFSWRTKSGDQGRVTNREKFEMMTLVSTTKKKLHVRGTLAGKALVYNVGKIVIDGDIFYKTSPEFDQDSEDYLGLVSENDVEIAPPKVTGAGDLYIYAAIMTKGTFRVVNFHHVGKSHLRLYGSLTAGSLTATEPRYGTRIVFDRRLETKRPPNFPLTNRYEMEEWDEKWKVK